MSGAAEYLIMQLRDGIALDTWDEVETVLRAVAPDKTMHALLSRAGVGRYRKGGGAWWRRSQKMTDRLKITISEALLSMADKATA